MKTLLGDFNVKIGRENILQPTIWNESVHPERNDNDIRLVTFATSKILITKSTTFPRHIIDKYNWTSPDGITQNQIMF